jgi:hypothetical protein
MIVRAVKMYDTKISGKRYIFLEVSERTKQGVSLYVYSFFHIKCYSGERKSYAYV